MKKTSIILFSLLALMLTFQSCKEDIELIGEFNETAIIYGLLDQSEEIHMIKITRAFGGGGMSALEVAQIPDSNYFQTVTGTVGEYLSGTLIRSFTLTDTVIPNKETSGVFYAPTQKMYYFKTASNAPLNENAEYRLNLSISHGSKSFTVFGSTNLVKGVSPTSATFGFYNSQGDLKNHNISVQGGNSHRLSAKLLINFEEFIGANSTSKSIEWNLGEDDYVPGGPQKFFSAAGATFYNLIAENVTNDPAIDKRNLTSITTVVTGASEEFVQYIDVNQPSSGLAQSSPTFTNLTASGDGSVIGIFSARQTLISDKLFFDTNNPFIRGLDFRSTQNLCIGPITGTLLFCSNHDNDNSQIWYCN